MTSQAQALQRLPETLGGRLLCGVPCGSVSLRLETSSTTLETTRWWCLSGV